MLEKLTYENMQAHLNTEFWVVDSDDPRVVMTLVEIRDLTTPATMPPEGQRAPFSLLFLAPSAFAISQRMLGMQHEALGTMDIFLVPVEQDEHGLYYEAVFN